jgi:L-asparaginase II
MSYSNYCPMVEVTRGPIVESVHFGAVAVVDSDGKLLASIGDPQTLTFLRSTAKPFQALPFIERDGAEKFGLTDREVAILCASHSGTDEHVGVVQGIQKKIGATEMDLLCGAHMPYHKGTERAMVIRGEDPTPNRHNCSGKHTGMLAHAILRNLPKDDYVNLNHPVQVSILSAFAEMCSLPEDKVVLGIDGCSAPNFAVPLYNAALAYARLCDPTALEDHRAAACQRITRAMSSNPNMVAGPGRFDTALMMLCSGELVSKAGAEGYQGIGLLPGQNGLKKGIGIAFKVADGDLGGRARPLIAMELLRQLDILTTNQLSRLADYGERPLFNFRNLEVGSLRSCFQLAKS